MNHTEALGDRLLNLARHTNMHAVRQLAEQIEDEAPELGIGIEREGKSIYLRYGDQRVEIGREGASTQVRFIGSLGSDMGTKPTRIVAVPIPVEVLREIALYLESKSDDGELPAQEARPRRPK